MAAILAGSDKNQNIAGLFTILTTYALNHPDISYYQGISDIVSPLLVIIDEPQVYTCFCASALVALESVRNGAPIVRQNVWNAAVG
jgi:Rab-GTPase-TBC domain